MSKVSKVKYEVNDKVVFKTMGVPAVGVITNVRTADRKTFYDLRSEAGSGYLLVPVDKAKNKYSESYAIIDSKLTASWNAAVDAGDCTPTRLFAKEGVGHTRANYADHIELWFDGENTQPNISVQQMEKRNDFVFPTQGPRSF
tara:strand:- start:1437 stop:1865 length:429 start_codon:yes stop_codon:yes gene_type:complete